MFKRTVLMAAAVLAVSACSSTDEDELPIYDTSGATERRDITTDGPLAEIYDTDISTLDANNTVASQPTQDYLVVNVGDRVFYGYDRYDINNDARQVLERQANWLKAHPGLNIVIEGHADERGTREYNLALGERRANSAKNYLVALGVDPRRVETISFGKERPASVGANPSAWAENRRGVTKIN